MLTRAVAGADKAKTIARGLDSLGMGWRCVVSGDVHTLDDDEAWKAESWTVVRFPSRGRGNCELRIDGRLVKALASPSAVFGFTVESWTTPRGGKPQRRR